MISLKEINEENLLEVLTLKVHPDQLDQVDTNAFSIAQGSFAKHAWFRGIYHGTDPVGFVMLDIDEQNNDYSLWRLMIDKKHQGKGYGKAGLQLAVEHLQSIPNATMLKSAYVPKEKGGAKQFYLDFGFVETGEQIDKENGHEVAIELSLKK